ncbi:MAG: lysophospholipase [Candidatus Cohnella colombiensis]|uniref:Lysophospholipase n=1 Tax=Candidatus Cohnella colombiensis TaxID=3121368 RepID=A0AA95F6H2_9BACL|nr:MAG: lysophospholipase [Cohnella sp.]
MTYKEMEWACADGNKMFACVWSPEHTRSAKAIVGIVHGMGEHMGRYQHVAEMLVNEGYTVIGFDQRGHGRTVGKRGHVAKFEELLEGVDNLIAEANRSYPNLPIFLYGHSMGGNVTINYLLRKKPQLKGAIVTGPWLKLAFAPPPIQVIAGKIIQYIYPKYTNHRPLHAASLTSDPVMVERYLNDPLGHGHITARFFFGVQRAGLWALNHANQLQVPMLLMHATEDRVTSSATSKIFAERAGKLVTWIGWPGFQHELHNELERERVFETIKSWLKEQLEQ